MKPLNAVSSTSLTQNRKPRYIMIGGFLGAGKTTAVGKLAQWLSAKKFRVGLITNDQGRNLVDTAILRSQGFATEEIPGGCFCCRFNSLVNAAEKLRLETRPDVFIAEPVGSCTDLVATVTFPLRKLYAADYIVAPVSVLVDPVRAERVFDLARGDSFSEKVIYIYRKQLEEADLIVISKCDLLDADRLAALRKAIVAEFPRKEVLAVSAQVSTNLDAWFSRITSELQLGKTAMKVDYEIYADGEALLGWLNCTVILNAKKAFAAEALLKKIAGEIQTRLKLNHAEIAHLKMTLRPSGSANAVAVANLVRNDFVPELSLQLPKPVTNGQLTINLRAEAAPDVLGTAVRQSLAAAAAEFPTLTATLDHLEHFRPGKPTPTHRFTRLAA
jgi:Ni2+-binding GTPase involved in maturation of urease and hydrogenase